ncbi:hypothetical protein HK100_008087, partial [Physocladia obscura]
MSILSSNFCPLDIPTLSWITPQPPIKLSLIDIERIKTSIKAKPTKKTTLSISDRINYMNLNKAEKKRLLFGGETKKRKVMRHDDEVLTDSDNNKDDDGGEDDDNEVNITGRKSKPGRKKKRVSLLQTANSAIGLPSADAGKPNYKLLPPYTDLLVTDPLPYAASGEGNEGNALLVPSNVYYHVQDDRCMNKKKYMEYPKCRSCIWKHRERLPHCFFVGFRAFLVKLDDGGVMIDNPEDRQVIGPTDEIIVRSGDVGGVPDESGNLESVSANIEGKTAAITNQKTVGGVPLMHSPTDPYRLLNDIPAENLVYGPFFIPDGVQIPGAITAVGTRSNSAVGNAENHHRAVLKIKKREHLASNDGTDIIEPPAKRAYVRRHKSISTPAFEIEKSDSIETISSVSASFTSRAISIAAANASSSSLPTATLPSAVATSASSSAAVAAVAAIAAINGQKNHKSKAVLDSADFPDLLATQPFPFVPSPFDETVNALIIAANTKYHIQSDKCLNKRYYEFPKCRSCRWKHKERLPHCFYIGFRVFGIKEKKIDSAEFREDEDVEKNIGSAGAIIVAASAITEIADDPTNVEITTTTATVVTNIQTQAEESSGKRDETQEILNFLQPPLSVPPAIATATAMNTVMESVPKNAGDPLRVFDVKPEDLIYGPYFVPGGVYINHSTVKTGGRGIGGTIRKHATSNRNGSTSDGEAEFSGSWTATSAATAARKKKKAKSSFSDGVSGRGRKKSIITAVNEVLPPNIELQIEDVIVNAAGLPVAVAVGDSDGIVRDNISNVVVVTEDVLDIVAVAKDASGEFSENDADDIVAPKANGIDETSVNESTDMIVDAAVEVNNADVVAKAIDEVPTVAEEILPTNPDYASVQLEKKNNEEIDSDDDGGTVGTGAEYYSVEQRISEAIGSEMTEGSVNAGEEMLMMLAAVAKVEAVSSGPGSGGGGAPNPQNSVATSFKLGGVLVGVAEPPIHDLLPSAAP